MTRFLKVVLLGLALLLGLGPVGLAPPAAWARQSMSFSPGDRIRGHYGKRARSHAQGGRAHRRAMRHGRTHPHASARSASVPRGTETRGDEGPAAKAVPGKGFTLDNGVLTYPAPARFQPQNLRHR